MMMAFFLRLCNFGKEGSLLVNKYFREWLFCSRSVFPTTFIPSFAIHFSRASPFYSFLFLLILLSLFIITIYFDMLDLSYNTEGRYWVLGLVALVAGVSGGDMMVMSSLVFDFSPHLEIGLLVFDVIEENGSLPTAYCAILQDPGARLTYYSNLINLGLV